MPYTGLEDGYGAPFIRLYYGLEELSAIVDDFEYDYFEEGDDVCKLELKLEDRNAADLPQWQERAELTIIWGFIGQEINPRKIYIQQILWKFEKEGVKASIEATEKAVSMKYQDSQEVHHDVSLLGLAKKFADRHNLKAMLEVDTTKELNILAPNDGPGPLSDYLVKNRKALSDWQRGTINKGPGLINNGERNSRSIPITDDLIKNASSNNVKDLADFINNYQKPRTQAEIDKANGIPLVGYNEFMRQHGLTIGIPQANKTDAQTLSDTAMKTQGGPWIVDTRDDTLTIKRRNFNQTPYKSYTWAGDEGSLLEFTPVSKTRGRLPAAMNVGFQYWDPKLKSILTGNANPDTREDEEQLSQYVSVYKFYKHLSDKGLGNKRIGDLGPAYLSSQNKYTDHGRADNTINNRKVPLFRLQDVNTRVEALKKALDEKITDIYNKTFNPAVQSAIDAENQANNLNKSNQLKLNPAAALLYGDPNLTVGKLITILGVSKKYSSNYYIIKANHKINAQGYMVRLEMATQGINIKATINHQKTKGSINKTIGPDVGDKTKRQIPITHNPK